MPMAAGTTHANNAAHLQFRVRLKVCPNLLARGEHDHCIVQSFLWFIPVELSASISSATLDVNALMQTMHSNSQVHVAGDIEAVKNVLTTEPPKPYRKAGMLWCPLVNNEGKVYALLRVERKSPWTCQSDSICREQQKLPGQQAMALATICSLARRKRSARPVSTAVTT